MNERIQDLSMQARKYAQQYVNESVIPYGKTASEFQRIFESKFAELLIKECARSVDKVYEDAEPDHGCYDWATFAQGSDVLKHFGVEE